MQYEDGRGLVGVWDPLLRVEPRKVKDSTLGTLLGYVSFTRSELGSILDSRVQDCLLSRVGKAQ
jgi:hypothetical protein